MKLREMVLALSTMAVIVTGVMMSEAAQAGQGGGTPSASIEEGMVFVKGGCFQMGDTAGGGSGGDKPVHEVCVGDFYIGKYEVTQRQWLDVIEDYLPMFRECDNCPMESVTWELVQEFIKRLNQKTGKTYRLPTEAEWEYAARGGSQGKNERYAGSNNPDEVAWHGGNSGNRTHEVGQKKPNALGLYDMNGNVWEWCSDWLGRDYYAQSPRENPQGPAEGNSKILRGGSWGTTSRRMSVSFRMSAVVDMGDQTIGLRLARNP